VIRARILHSQLIFDSREFFVAVAINIYEANARSFPGMLTTRIIHDPRVLPVTGLSTFLVRSFFTPGYSPKDDLAKENFFKVNHRPSPSLSTAGEQAVLPPPSSSSSWSPTQTGQLTFASLSGQEGRVSCHELVSSSSPKIT